MGVLATPGKAAVTGNVLAASQALVDHYLPLLVALGGVTVSNVGRLPHLLHDRAPRRPMSATMLGAVSRKVQEVSIFVAERRVEFGFVV